ncbi:MAG TPA: hypothetical protein VKA43_15720 [Gammaproteobacteria bacterium]|nr:hypothetical protein [Gammaproteobacteria bacterium]
MQLEDYANGLAVMQLASNVGLVTEDSEVRRLADLLLFNDVPYRCGQVLEGGIEKKIVTLDEKLYEKLANCWIAAGELDKSVAPLQRAAELAPSGDTFVRLGESTAKLPVPYPGSRDRFRDGSVRAEAETWRRHPAQSAHCTGARRWHGRCCLTRITGTRGMAMSQFKHALRQLYLRPALSATYYVRSSLDGWALARTIPEIMKRIDPNLPPSNLTTVRNLVEGNTRFDRPMS